MDDGKNRSPLTLIMLLANRLLSLITSRSLYRKVPLAIAVLMGVHHQQTLMPLAGVVIGLTKWGAARNSLTITFLWHNPKTYFLSFFFLL
jgi:hypothetical protein